LYFKSYKDRTSFTLRKRGFSVQRKKCTCHCLQHDAYSSAQFFAWLVLVTHNVDGLGAKGLGCLISKCQSFTSSLLAVFYTQCGWSRG
jgi:hypothetical protein